MRKRLQHIVTNSLFRLIFFALTIIFVISTFFISLDPKGFIKYGYGGIIVFNVISSGLLLIPTLIKTFNLPLLVLASAIGNIPNTSINYLVGSTGKSFLVHASWMQRIKEWMKRFEVVVIYALAIIPLPLDVNGLLSGYMGVSYKKYVIINFLGKITVFTLVALGIISLAKK